MVYLSGIVSVLLVALIACLALSKKTSPGVRRTAIIALVLIGLAITACSLLLFLLGPPTGGSEGIAVEIPIIPPETTRKDMVPVIVFSLILLFIIMVIVLASLREKKKR
jgi:cytochrome bd-type quinol oxidase subunit 2